MFLLAATLAHAGLRADIDREARDAPQIAVACASARDTIVRLEEIAREVSEVPMPPEMRRFVDELESVLAPESRLAFAWWKEGSTLRIGFDTSLDVAALAQAVATLDAERPGVAEQGPDGWRVRDPGGMVLRVEVKEGWATLADGSPPSVDRSLPAALLAALPDGDGCILAANVPDDTLGNVDAALHLPAERGRPATFAIATPILQDSPAILLEGALPPTVATPQVPEALVVVGVGLDSIDFSVFLEGKELRQARRLQNQFPVTGGTTLALLQTSPAPKVAAVVPFADAMPARRIARRTQRILRQLEIGTTRIDPTHFVIRVEELELLAATAPGRLYLTSDPGTLNAMERGVGEPWVAGEIAETAVEWPVLITSRVFPGGDGVAPTPLPRPLLLALDVEGGVVKGLVDLPLSFAQIKTLGQAIDAARAARKQASDTER